MSKENGYCGYTNYETWNVCLYIDNMSTTYEKSQAWRKAVEEGRCQKTYDSLLDFIGMRGRKTFDDVSFTDKAINHEEVLDCVLSD